MVANQNLSKVMFSIEIAEQSLLTVYICWLLAECIFKYKEYSFIFRLICMFFVQKLCIFVFLPITYRLKVHSSTTYSQNIIAAVFQAISCSTYFIIFWLFSIKYWGLSVKLHNMIK